MNHATFGTNRRGRALVAGSFLVGAGLLASCAPAPRAPGPAVAAGSGCVAPEVLPDGIWWGFIHSADGTVGFDLACLYSGEEAIAAAIEDGENPDNLGEVYIRNDQTRLRMLPARADISCTVFKYLGVGRPEGSTESVFATTTGNLNHLAERLVAHRLPVPATVRIVDGVVDVVIETYLA